MRTYQTSGSFDIFPQHCLLLEFTPDHHALKLYNEVIESTQNMKKHVKTQLLKKMAKALRTITTAPATTPVQRAVAIQLKG